MSDAVRCTEFRVRPWRGHTAALGYFHCRNMTLHPSGRCYLHLSGEDATSRWERRYPDGLPGSVLYEKRHAAREASGEPIVATMVANGDSPSVG